MGHPILLAAPPLPLSANTYVVLAVAGVTILYAVLRPMAARKKKDPLSRPPSQTSLAQQRSVERQMQNLLVELSEMARQITAQLDTRAARLELLIKEADEKIAAMKAAAGQPVASRPDVSSAESSFASRLSELSLSRLGVVGERPAQTAPERDAAAVVAAPAPADPRHAQVYALADEGRGAGDIARQLNRPKGEVELILALRPRG